MVGLEVRHAQTVAIKENLPANKLTALQLPFMFIFALGDHPNPCEGYDNPWGVCLLSLIEVCTDARLPSQQSANSALRFNKLRQKFVAVDEKSLLRLCSMISDNNWLVSFINVRVIVTFSFKHLILTPS